MAGYTRIPRRDKQNGLINSHTKERYKKISGYLSFGEKVLFLPYVSGLKFLCHVALLWVSLWNNTRYSPWYPGVHLIGPRDLKGTWTILLRIYFFKCAEMMTLKRVSLGHAVTNGTSTSNDYTKLSLWMALSPEWHSQKANNKICTQENIPIAYQLELLIRTGRRWGTNNSSGEGNVDYFSLFNGYTTSFSLGGLNFFLCLSCELQISIFPLVMSSLHGCFRHKSKTESSNSDTHIHINISLPEFHISRNEPPSTQVS